MAFRIRKTDFDSEDVRQIEKAWKANNKLYRKHLAKLIAKDFDLWKYFYWDFFHDGEISKISFWDTPGDITFHINCPNIKKRNGDFFDFVQGVVEFECHFRSVVYFFLDHENPEELLFEQHHPFQYLYSEIDTLTELIEKKSIKGEDEDGEEYMDFHSLIIEVLGAKSSFCIEMIFSQVDVYPKEPIAFELMLASDEFYIPIYREGQDMNKLPKWISNPGGTKYIPDEDEDS